MRADRRLVQAAAFIGVATVLWLCMTFGLIASTLDGIERAFLMDHLAPRLPLLGVTWLLGLLSIVLTLRWLFFRYATAPARLVEQTQVLLAAPKAAPMNHHGTQETQALAEVIFQLAIQRDSLRENVAEQVAAASAQVRQEKNLLAALMSELTQSVVVCSLDGRIILYNNRALWQFKSLSQAPGVTGGAELVGIGRSIYGAFDRHLIAHALEIIHQRTNRGAVRPLAQFVTTTQAGQLLKVQMAPVRNNEAADSAGELSGFVLMFDDVTSAFEQENERCQLLHGLIEHTRVALGSIQEAFDGLVKTDPDAHQRAVCVTAMQDEVARLNAYVSELTNKSAQVLKTRWPLEDMMGADVLLAAQRRIELRTKRSVTLENLEPDLWLKVDSFSLTQALEYLALRLADEFDVRFFRLRLQHSSDRAQLDLIWSGQAVSTETVMSWEMESMRFGTESTPLSVRDVVDRHSGQMWFERERVRHEAYFRFMLPFFNVPAPMADAPVPSHTSRPEYYDFDLFQTTDQSCALDDRLLSNLAYTVFDTETTGLSPSEGDEIIQIGATRCINGKLLRQESFEQLVNPGRLIPKATIPIHGITQDMVRGKPDIAEVLPAFHAFAQDTVLVAHNAAFDMKFLQLQEAKTHIVFHHPVLDTLLLSAVVHPSQASHRLEAIAARFNINVLGRHTALGDAMLTAEVWLRLIPLLQAMGIFTLRQAREAAQKTYMARLKY